MSPLTKNSHLHIKKKTPTNTIVIALREVRPKASLVEPVNGHVKHGRVIADQILRSLAVVHVEVHDGNALHAVLPACIARCKCDVVEEAEATGFGS